MLCKLNEAFVQTDTNIVDPTHKDTISKVFKVM